MSSRQDFATRLQHAIDTKTKPRGALGRVEELAMQVGLLQQSLTPKMQTCCLTIFAADHGIAAEGVSAFPPDVTAQMVMNFLAGGAAANVFASSVGVDLSVVDAGISTPVEHAQLIDRRAGAGTANSLLEPAMTTAALEKILDDGRALGADGAYDAMCFGEMGIANTSASALVAAKVMDVPVGGLVGRGTGVDDAGLAHKMSVLEAAMKRTGPLSAYDAIQEYGGFEIAMMCGAMQGAAQAGRLVIVDGFIASVAALVALAETPDIRPALVFAHVSAESGHAVVLEHLSAKPLLDLGLRLGEGTGALLAWPLIRAAVAMLNDMASFDDAAVSGAI